MKTVFYLHGMGGGETSRIPNHLRHFFAELGRDDIQVICPTYDFDPEIAHPFILSEIERCKPDLIIGESLGAVHAIRTSGYPLLLVSPAIGGPEYMYRIAPWTLIPGIPWICSRFIWHVKYPGRQKLNFRYRILMHYKAHKEAMLAAAAIRSGRGPRKACRLQRLRTEDEVQWSTKPFEGLCPEDGGSKNNYVHAFIGDYDHYRKNGVVDPDKWDALFGPETRTSYPGTHYMEDEYIRSLLVPAILSLLAAE